MYVLTNQALLRRVYNSRTWLAYSGKALKNTRRRMCPPQNNQRTDRNTTAAHGNHQHRQAGRQLISRACRGSASSTPTRSRPRVRRRPPRNCRPRIGRTRLPCADGAPKCERDKTGSERERQATHTETQRDTQRGEESSQVTRRHVCR